MTRIRRRLASWALVLTVLQSAAGLAAPLSACCATNGRQADRETAQMECCPAGAHPPGECPLHRSARAHAADRAATCRMHCDSTQQVQFLIGTAGVLPAPAVTALA